MGSKCTKCGDTEHYNFALNIGLCDPCIGERIEELEADAKINQSVCDTIEKEVTKINEKLKVQIKELKQENRLLRIDLAEALEYCIGDDIEAATKSLETALKAK